MKACWEMVKPYQCAQLKAGIRRLSKVPFLVPAVNTKEQTIIVPSWSPMLIKLRLQTTYAASLMVIHFPSKGFSQAIPASGKIVSKIMVGSDDPQNIPEPKHHGDDFRSILKMYFMGSSFGIYHPHDAHENDRRNPNFSIKTSRSWWLWCADIFFLY